MKTTLFADAPLGVKVTTPANRAPASRTGLFTDSPTLGQRAGAAGLSLAQGVAQDIPQVLAGAMALNPASQVARYIPGLESVAEPGRLLTDYAARAGQILQELKAPSIQREEARPILFDPTTGAFDPQMPSVSQLVNVPVRSTALLGPTMKGGSFAANAISKLPGIGEKFARFLGYGTSNATMISAQTYADTYPQAYVTAKSEGRTDDEADALAHEAGTQAARDIALVSLVTGGAGLGAAAGMTGRMIPRIVKGTVADMPFEAIEETAQQAAQQRALNEVDPREALEAGAQGALAAGVMGGGTAALEGRPRPKRPVEPEILSQIFASLQKQAGGQATPGAVPSGVTLPSNEEISRLLTTKQLPRPAQIYVAPVGEAGPDINAVQAAGRARQEGEALDAITRLLDQVRRDTTLAEERTRKEAEAAEARRLPIPIEPPQRPAASVLPPIQVTPTGTAALTPGQVDPPERAAREAAERLAAEQEAVSFDFPAEPTRRSLQDAPGREIAPPPATEALPQPERIPAVEPSGPEGARASMERYYEDDPEMFETLFPSDEGEPPPGGGGGAVPSVIRRSRRRRGPPTIDEQLAESRQVQAELQASLEQTTDSFRRSILRGLIGIQEGHQRSLMSQARRQDAERIRETGARDEGPGPRREVRQPEAKPHPDVGREGIRRGGQEGLEGEALGGRTPEGEGVPREEGAREEGAGEPDSLRDDGARIGEERAPLTIRRRRTAGGRALAKRHLRPEQFRTRSDGSIIGAPPSRPRIEDQIQPFSEALDHLEDPLAEPETSVEWYESAGREIARLTHGDRRLAEQVIRVLALYSPKNSVPSNYTVAVKAAYALAKGDVLPGHMYLKQDELTAALRAKQFTQDLAKVGNKVEAFHHNLSDATFNDNRWPDAVTVDLWISRYLFDKDGVSGRQYEFASEWIRSLTRAYNERHGADLLPRQVQAMLWTYEANRRGEVSGGFGHEFGRAQQQVTWEAVPSTSLPQGESIAALDDARKAEFTAGARALLQNPETRFDELASRVGALLHRGRPATGRITPSVVTSVIAPKLNGKFPREIADAYARAIQYIFRQDAVPWFRADPGLEKGTEGVMFEFSEPLTVQADKEFFDRLRKHMGEGAGYTRVESNQIAVLNFTEAPEFLSQMEAFAVEYGSRVKTIFFRAETAYHEHSWGTDPEGEAILEGLKGSPAGSPDLLRWLRDRRQAFDALAARYAPPARRGRGRRVTRRQRIDRRDDQDAQGRDVGAVRRVDRARNAERNRARGLPVRGDGRVPLVHYSNAERDVIDPEFFGTGPLRGEERRRAWGPDFVKRAYLGLPGYRRETGLGGFRHDASIHPGDLYDLAGDPDGIRRSAGLDVTLAERLIRDAGYKGYFNLRALGGAIAVFEKVQVERGQEKDPHLRSIETAVSETLKNWENAPHVQVVESEADLPGEPTGDTAGMWTDEDGGTVYLVADQISTPAEAIRTLIHEVVGHHGVRAVLGTKGDAFFERLATDHKDEVGQYAEQYGLDMETREGRIEASEEWIAHLAEEKSNRHPTILDRIIVRVARALRAIAPSIKWTRAEVRSLIAASRGFVEKRRQASTGRGVSEAIYGSAPVGATSFGVAGEGKSPPLQREEEEVLSPSTPAPPGISRRRRRGTAVKPGETIADAYRRRIGNPAYEAVANFSRTILSKAKLADTTPTEFKRMLRAQRAQVARAGRTIEQLAGHLKHLSPAERELISDYIEGEVKAGITPPKHIIEVARQIVATLDAQSQSLVDVGFLPPESREFYRGRYLARYYSKHLDERSLINRFLHKSFKRIDGSRFKARGLFEFIPETRQAKYEALGWVKRADGRKEGEVLMWRDWKKGDREKWGEVRDAAYRFIRGYMEGAKDLAMGRLFQTMAQSSEISSDTQTERFSKQVPSDSISGSRIRKFGEMAGRWVEPEVWDHLEYQVSSGDENDLWKAYLKGLSLWKEGKVVLNPVAHGNNVVSNLMMADFAGIPPWRGDKYWAALREYRKKGPVYQEALDAGLFGTEFYGTEIAAMMPALDAFRNQATATAGFLSRMWNYLARFSGARAYRRAMGRMYQAEDQFFKLLIYMDQRKKDASRDEAVDHAERYVFNYMDLPKGARRIRNLAIPFFSYTYNAIPALTHTMLTQPWKVAKWAGLFMGANWAAFQYLFGDEGDDREEDERKVMDDYMKGWTWMHIPFTELGVPKTIRLARNDANGEALYFDLSRMVPLGDIMDVQNQMGGVPIPQPFMPNNPIFSMTWGLLANIDSFSGRPVTKPSDTDWEALGKQGRWLAMQLLPNTPLMPGSYSFGKVMQGIANETGPIDLGPLGEFTGEDYLGRKQTLGRAVAGTVFALKVRPVDVEQERHQRVGELKRQIRDLKYDRKRALTDRSILKSTRENRVADILESIKRVRGEISDLRQRPSP